MSEAPSQTFEAFVAGCGPTRHGEGVTAAELESLVDRVRQDVSKVLPVDEAFAFRLGELWARTSAPNLGSLAEFCLEDLYLASACVDGDPQAISILRSQYLGDCRAALAAQGNSPTEIDEILQRVFHEVLVAPEGRCPRISSYSGRGSLRRWLRSVALRVASQTARKRSREVAVEDAMLDEGSDRDNMELEHLRAEYREDFKRGFEAVFRELPARDRTVLRQYFVDGLTVEAMAKLYGVHKSTCARWVSAARRRVLADASTQICTNLGLEADEMMSILRLVRSRLDLSVDWAAQSEAVHGSCH